MRVTSEDVAQVHEELAELSSFSLICAQLKHPVSFCVPTVDESFAEASEAERQPFALLTLKP